MKNYTVIVAALLLISAPALAGNSDDRSDDNQSNRGGCQIPSEMVSKVQDQLATVVKMPNGGLFSPNRMWSAIVDRVGTLCSVIVTGDAWPGSRAIAIAKASTANDFSNSALALSTANLYSPTQPGGSLYGLNNSNPFNPKIPAARVGDRLRPRWDHYLRRWRGALLRRQGRRRPWGQW